MDGENSGYGGSIADGDALHHAHDAQMGKVKRSAVHGHVEPVDEQSDEEEQQRALDGLTGLLWCPPESAFTKTEIGGDAHDEKEEGKDEVTGRHPVPFGVLQSGEDLLTGTVVHEDHKHDCQTAQNVEAHQSFHCICILLHHVLSILLTDYKSNKYILNPMPFMPQNCLTKRHLFSLSF